MKSFDIVEDAWIDVLMGDGTLQTCSLRCMLNDLHLIDRISESSALTEAGVLRFLIALVSDGLRSHVSSNDAWLPFAERCQSGLPSDAVAAILAPLKNRSDVLAADHDAFFDAPAVRRVSGWNEPNARQSISRFLPELPTGTNLAHFTHLSDDQAVLCIGCVLKSRTVDAAFARGGLGPSLSRNLLATISGTEPRYVVIIGSSLLRTVLLNLIVGDQSRPSWVSIHKPACGDPGPIARMSWRPRLIMPVVDGGTIRSCVRCGNTDRPRFKHAVMVDTYNYPGSPYGSKSDIERWKVAGCDPHLMPMGKNLRSLGQDPKEWPLRAITRLISDSASTSHAITLQRCQSINTPVFVMVVSSAGNQAKIDDAPTGSIGLPPGLLKKSPQDRTAIAAALGAIFEPVNRNARKQRIPDKTPELLRNLAASDQPQIVVAEWLGSSERVAQAEPLRDPAGHVARPHADSEYGEADSLQYAAKQIIKRLAGLPPSKLASLRSVAKGGAVNVATRQAAFELVWHGVGLPRGSKRHAVRQALATVASIYAVHSACHRPSHIPDSFDCWLSESLKRQRLEDSESSKEKSLCHLLSRLVNASPNVRDNLLMRLIDRLIAAAPNQQTRLFDFGALLAAVALWNDPTNPTPTRWKRLLHSIEQPVSTQ